MYDTSTVAAFRRTFMIDSSDEGSDQEPQYGDDDDEEEEEGDTVYEENVVKVKLPPVKPVATADAPRAYDFAASTTPHYDMAAAVAGKAPTYSVPTESTPPDSVDSNDFLSNSDFTAFQMPESVMSLLSGLSGAPDGGVHFELPELAYGAGLDEQFGFHDDVEF